MTHPIYSEQYLESLPLQQLKEIAAQLGTKATVDKRYKKSWILVILRKQASVEKVEEPAPQPQTIQSEASHAIDTLAEWMEESGFTLSPVPEPSSEQVLEQQRFSEKVCEILCLKIYDLELEYGDVVIPPGVPSWEVYDFCGVLEGCITKHPSPNHDTYHTPDGGVFSDPYTAALSLVNPADLVWAKEQVVDKEEECAISTDYSADWWADELQALKIEDLGDVGDSLSQSQNRVSSPTFPLNYLTLVVLDRVWGYSRSIYRL